MNITFAFAFLLLCIPAWCRFFVMCRFFPRCHFLLHDDGWAGGFFVSVRIEDFVPRWLLLGQTTSLRLRLGVFFELRAFHLQASTPPTGLPIRLFNTASALVPATKACRQMIFVKGDRPLPPFGAKAFAVRPLLYVCLIFFFVAPSFPFHATRFWFWWSGYGGCRHQRNVLLFCVVVEIVVISIGLTVVIVIHMLENPGGYTGFGGFAFWPTRDRWSRLWNICDGRKQGFHRCSWRG